MTDEEQIKELYMRNIITERMSSLFSLRAGNRSLKRHEFWRKQPSIMRYRT